MQRTEMLQVFLKCISKMILLQLTLFILVSCDNKDTILVSQLEFTDSQNNVGTESNYELTEISDINENDTVPININGSDIAWDHLTNYHLIISEPENRDFDISYPVEVEDENCYKITLMGKLIDGGTYLIDTFAININNYTSGLYESCKCYYYDNKTEQFENLHSGSKLYSSVTSPSGKYRLENAEIADGSANGGFAKLRIIDLTTGEFSWVVDGLDYSYYRIWSEDSRFVAFELQWIWSSDIVIVDTVDFSKTKLISNEISFILPDDDKYEIGFGDEHYYIIDNWVDSSILQIKFHCFTGRDEFHGEYQYDAINKTIKNIMIENEEDS